MRKVKGEPLNLEHGFAFLSVYWVDVGKILKKCNAPTEWGADQKLILLMAAVCPVGLDEISWQPDLLDKLIVGKKIKLTGVMFYGILFLRMLAKCPEVVIKALPMIREFVEGKLSSPEWIATQFVLMNDETVTEKAHTIAERLKEIHKLPFTVKVIDNARERVRTLFPPK